MNIIFICPSILPVPAVKGGAIETLIQAFIDENEKYNNDVYVTIFSSYDGKAQLKSKRYSKTKFVWIYDNKLGFKLVNFLIRTFRKISKSKSPLLRIRIIKNKLLKKSYDKIIIEGNYDHVYEISKIVPKQKIYFHIHANIFNNYNDYYNKILNSCERIIVVSSFIKNKILNFYKISDDKIIVLHNCFNEYIGNLNNNENFNIAEKYGINKNETIILFTGRVILEKGILILLKALKKVNNELHYKLIIAGSFGSNFGSGNENIKIKEIIEKEAEPISSKIIYTGFIDKLQLNNIYLISDLIIVPSLIEDAAPLVPIEAMAFGMPLIVTDSGGICEYVNEHCAIILQRNENLIDKLKVNIEKLLKDKNLREKMGNAAKKQSNLFTQNNYYENFLRLLLN
ncbi:MAG: glycosyltransferase family 4 protein [Ignavibacterium sp.]